MDYVVVAATACKSVRLGGGQKLSTTINSIRARSQPIGCAQTLLSVDAGPSREGSLSIAPGVRFRCEAPGVAASTSNPWARPQPLEKKTTPRNRRPDFLGSPRRSGYGKFRKVRSARAWEAD